MDNQTYQYIIYTCIAVGLAAVAYYVVSEIQDWLTQRKQYAEAHRLATQNYTNGLLERIEWLEQALRDAATGQLALVEERNTLANRCKMLARELACDPDKKTQILVK